MRTFKKGGVHFKAHKFTNDMQAIELSLPENVYISLKQHFGAPAETVVNKGDKVKVGTLIAKAASGLSANIHSSVSGTVEKIDKQIGVSGYPEDMIIIKVEGDDWEENINTSSKIEFLIKNNREQILEKIFNSGIVGMGGAGFPTHIKYNFPEGKRCEFFIANGVECETHLTCDNRLMIEKFHEILIGIQICKKALGVAQAFIGIEANKPEAISIMEKYAKEYEGIQVVPLMQKYPQGGEKQLIEAIIGRQVPSGGLPIDVGCVVSNVGTIFAVYEAVQKNKPLIERIVTFSGDNKNILGNFKVRVGTKISHIINNLSQETQGVGKIIAGGMMTGKALISFDVPITKTMSGVLLVDEKNAFREKDSNCIRCASCVDVCPMGLQPYLLTLLAKKGNFEEMKNENVMDCIECGSCTYACPAKIPLLDACRLGKIKIREKK